MKPAIVILIVVGWFFIEKVWLLCWCGMRCIVKIALICWRWLWMIVMIVIGMRIVWYLMALLIWCWWRWLSIMIIVNEMILTKLKEAIKVRFQRWFVLQSQLTCFAGSNPDFWSYHKETCSCKVVLPVHRDHERVANTIAASANENPFAFHLLRYLWFCTLWRAS